MSSSQQMLLGLMWSRLRSFRVTGLPHSAYLLAGTAKRPDELTVLQLVKGLAAVVAQASANQKH
jgi:hypothetical protein